MSDGDTFLERLERRLGDGLPPAIVGLDPRVAALPATLEPSYAPERITAFYREALPVLASLVVGVKPNIAFFERYGAAGYAAYETTCRLADELGLVVIGDIKRGDIGSTATAYAEAHLPLAHAVTVHPYLGRDALAPFVARCRETGGGLFVLVRTSNPSSAELQTLVAGGERVCDAVARMVDELAEDLPITAGYSPVGAVVGATHPDDVAALRRLMPRAWLLLPGVGAQGASAADCAAAFDHAGRGGLITSSRGVMQAFAPDDDDWLHRIEVAATGFAADVAAAVATAGERP